MDGFASELVEILGEGRRIDALVSERAPTLNAVTQGETRQLVKLLLPSGELLHPPMRVAIRGAVARVLGTQQAPVVGEPSLVTCRRVHADLPDAILIYRKTTEFDRATNRDRVTEVGVWSGEAHVASGDPRAVAVAGEQVALNAVTVTLPMDVASMDLSGCWVRVLASPSASTLGVKARYVGDVLDSSSALRRIVAHREGVV